MVPALSIKAGDTFRYVCDNDILGNPIWSAEMEASEDAFVMGTAVFIPFGGPEGNTFMGKFDSDVEKL